jgi:hypothetical protein
MSGRVRLRFRLRDRLRFRQGVRLRFPALCAPFGAFPCTFAGFCGTRTGDISMSAGESPVSRSLTGDSPGLCPVHGCALRSPLASLPGAFPAVRSLLCRPATRPLPWTVSSAHRVVASRRRCFAALSRLVRPVAFPVPRCAVVRGCTVQPSLSRRLPGRWCNGPRAARRRSGGAR